jgi:uncharacterized phage protein (TIGR01671 family)
MRERKYRGQCKDGKWVYGSLINNAFKYTEDDSPVMYIFSPSPEFGCFEDMVDGEDIFEVKPESVGDFIGIHDKHGKEIYEGDVVSILDRTTRREPYIGEVKWNEQVTGFEAYPKGQDWGMFLHNHPMLTAPIIPELQKFIGADKTLGRTIEIIGNIWENPNLLEDKS